MGELICDFRPFRLWNRRVATLRIDNETAAICLCIKYSTKWRHSVAICEIEREEAEKKRQKERKEERETGAKRNVARKTVITIN